MCDRKETCAKVWHANERSAHKNGKKGIHKENFETMTVKTEGKIKSRTMTYADNESMDANHPVDFLTPKASLPANREGAVGDAKKSLNWQRRTMNKEISLM